MSGRLLTTLLVGLTMATTVPATADTVKVKLEMPVKATLDLEERETLLAAPFLVVRQEGESRFRGQDIDVQEEFQRYLDKLLRRDTELEVLELQNLEYPTYDLTLLARDSDFWAALGERTGADLILTGSLDFDVQDRSGYRLEEYTSPFDGKTYYRQVLVEETGFEFDILLQVYDGETGELLHEDNFKDFRTLEGAKVDPVAGMFRNLRALEDRIVGIFAQKTVEATRLLLR